MRSTHRLPLLLSAGVAGLLLAAMPLGFNGSTFGPAPAWADSANGHGHGNGKANANANDANHGSIASSLGALNAAHASANALAHASPNSRVGKIAAYKEAAIAAKAADQAVADAQANLDAANQAVADAQKALDDAEAALAANVDPAKVGPLTAAVTAAQTNLDNANAAAADAQTALTDAQNAAATADATRDQALAAAANKPITDQVIDAVNNLLGIN